MELQGVLAYPLQREVFFSTDDASNWQRCTGCSCCCTLNEMTTRDTSLRNAICCFVNNCHFSPIGRWTNASENTFLKLG
jgi:hypothetical protein